MAYVAGITAFGSWLGRSKRGVEGYFSASRAIPFWAVAFCIVATETSTLTFIGVPGMAYGGDWRFLQLAFGYILGRLLIAAIFLPAYFRGTLFTSYELLQGRFGGPVRTTAASLFLSPAPWATGSVCTPPPSSSPWPPAYRNGDASSSWASP